MLDMLVDQIFIFRKKILKIGLVKIHGKKWIKTFCYARRNVITFFFFLLKVIFIFDNLTKSGEEACDILNICSSSLSKSHSRFGQRQHDIKKSNPIKNIKKNDQFSSPLPRRTKRAIRKNTFTVAHITDIHVEPGYLNVSTNVLPSTQIVLRFLSK